MLAWRDCGPRGFAPDQVNVDAFQPLWWVNSEAGAEWAEKKVVHPYIQWLTKVGTTIYSVVSWVFEWVVYWFPRAGFNHFADLGSGQLLPVQHARAEVFSGGVFDGQCNDGCI